ncbi:MULTISPECIES: COG4280 domain-containing protein [Streptomyces]|uniref:COG4280 domain-containing protein n=1 Tax=Streptomyces TaxID=1883 RepID=UPI00136F1AB9|nr:TMEM165/GDT1 family protein [Streptomyces sp. SID2888]MYV49710.1 TMEM165/GDT1 family protein [Streptomyces sp. SID2888]
MGATYGLVAAVFVASLVEAVEALTIVMAMGMTRGWKSAWAGTAAAAVALAAFTAAAGYSLASWLPEAALQLAIGSLLLVFGLQWLRKAILRSSGLKALHDEEKAFAEQTSAARDTERTTRFGLDWFAFTVSFKGVFLEGVEVVFIVITFGMNAHNVPVAALAAVGAALCVTVAGSLAHGPLSRVPENALKYGVGLLLASFGTYWAVEGLGVFTSSGQSVEWFGHDWSILVLIAVWFAVSRILIKFVPGIAIPSCPTLAAEEG